MRLFLQSLTAKPALLLLLNKEPSIALSHWLSLSLSYIYLTWPSLQNFWMEEGTQGPFPTLTDAEDVSSQPLIRSRFRYETRQSNLPILVISVVQGITDKENPFMSIHPMAFMILSC